MTRSKVKVVRSLLRVGVQPTLDPSAETFMSVQCASPGRGGELVGMCELCRVEEGLSRREVKVTSPLKLEIWPFSTAISFAPITTGAGN